MRSFILLVLLAHPVAAQVIAGKVPVTRLPHCHARREQPPRTCFLEVVDPCERVYWCEDRGGVIVWSRYRLDVGVRKVQKVRLKLAEAAVKRLLRAVQ